MVPSVKGRQLYAQAMQWYSWLSVLCSHWPKDVDPRPVVNAKVTATAKPKVKRRAKVVKAALTADGRASKVHASHRLRSTGDLLWCDCCGAYGQLRFKALKERCLGGSGAATSSRKGQLIALRNGKHPLTGLLLGATSAVQRRLVGNRELAWGAREPAGRDRERDAGIGALVAVQGAVGKAVHKLQMLHDRRVACALGKLLSWAPR